MNNFIGINISYLVDKLNCTQDEFGALFDLKRGNVNQYVKEKAQPKIETIQKICKHFEISIDDFINLDLSTLPKSKHSPLSQVAEPAESYGDKELIKALKETVEVQKTLIENYKQQLHQAS